MFFFLILFFRHWLLHHCLFYFARAFHDHVPKVARTFFHSRYLANRAFESGRAHKLSARRCKRERGWKIPSADVQAQKGHSFWSLAFATRLSVSVFAFASFPQKRRCWLIIVRLRRKPNNLTACRLCVDLFVWFLSLFFIIFTSRHLLFIIIFLMPLLRWVCSERSNSDSRIKRWDSYHRLTAPNDGVMKPRLFYWLTLTARMKRERRDGEGIGDGDLVFCFSCFSSRWWKGGKMDIAACCFVAKILFPLGHLILVSCWQMFLIFGRHRCLDREVLKRGLFLWLFFLHCTSSNCGGRSRWGCNILFIKYLTVLDLWRCCGWLTACLTCCCDMQH